MTAPSLTAPEADLADDMARRWQQGERPLVEEYIARHPALSADAEAALELLSEELSLRQEFGEPISDADLARRFPRWRPQVLALLQWHQALAAPPTFPAPGAALGEFRLVAEIGRGAHGRVYLARQPALADRLVVLKLAPDAGSEHLRLARLQHSHIAPLYSARDFPERGLRALCLPYFGGATLAELLPTDSAAGLLDALRQRQAAAPVELPVGGPACDFLASASWVDAVCWLGACLADALHYAHQRGLVHLDVKPGNILIAADGQPMLLDFHLTREPLAAGASAPGWLGGTPGYMAPEHEVALRAVSAGWPVPADVDARADVYSLGRVLLEMLGGSATDSLAALLRRCTAADPARRYASAGDVASDLRRHLADLPMHGVWDRRPLDVWGRWRRRRPHGMFVLVLLLGAVAAGAALVAQASRQAGQARAALREAEDHLAARRYEQAVDGFRHGASVAEGVPLGESLRHRCEDGRVRAERALAAAELHRFCERVRPLYAMEPLPQNEARAVTDLCRRFWARRDQIRACLDAPGDPDAVEQVRADLLDLAILWAHLRARVGASEGARREALDLLAQAAEELGPSCVLHQERRIHLAALGRHAEADRAARQAEQTPPRGAWEHFALGRAFYEAGDWRGGMRELDRSLELQPGALWPTFYRGCCACRLGDHEEAVIAFSVCVALAGEQPWCLHNRAVAYQGMGRSDRARRDLERVVALAPDSADAAHARQILEKLGDPR